MSFFGGGGGGNDNLFWEQKMMLDNEKRRIEAITAEEKKKNDALAATAEAKRLAMYTQGGLASLASNGYAGFGDSKALGGTPAPLGG